MDGSLACIESTEEGAFIRLLANKKSVWIGGWKGKDGKWRWETGESMAYTNWQPGEPNNANGTEDRVAMDGNGSWNDLPHSSTIVQGFVCEWELSAEDK